MTDASREAVRNGALGILVDPSDQEGIKAGVLEALNRLKGVVPEGLEYFSYGSFERRLHRIVESIIASEGALRRVHGGRA
jgi:phosphatidyl-myo-inositol dimannoside synthase